MLGLFSRTTSFLGKVISDERWLLFGLSCIALLSLWLAPWAALSREVSATSALLLLPNRLVDFTGDTAAVPVSGLGATLALAVILLAIIATASLLKKQRYIIWMLAGAALIVLTAISLSSINQAVATAKIQAFVDNIEGRLENPRDTWDAPALEAVVATAFEKPLTASAVEARAAGINVRLSRLPYDGGGIGFAAFLCYLVGGFAILFALRFSKRLSALIDRLFVTVSVPAIAMFLALVAMAAVVLAIQPTPIGREVAVAPGLMYLIGRIDTVWYSYVTLFSDSLGTLNGFLESLKFSTSLIFTGLAVAFSFRAGLFNIGAPGQMVLGAIFAMFVGVYMPGPRFIVLPLAVIASAVGGGIWGAIPGWLKARFGANEVINTILMNFIASSFLLFILAPEQVFNASALRIISAILIFSGVAAVLAFVPLIRNFMAKSPRLVLAVSGLVLLVAMLVVGVPRASDAPVNLNLPFKAAGSELKSHPIQETAQLSQLPALLGIDAAVETVVPVNLALFFAPFLALLMLFIAPHLSKRLQTLPYRIGAALIFGLVSYGVLALFGLSAKELSIPPTRLNTSFVLSLLAAVLVYYLLFRTKWGYELRAVGLAPKAAEYGGASIARNTILAMTISGALAGLTACHYVLGGALDEYALRQILPTNDGFDGIAVALLGNNTPVGVVLSAFLFGVLKHGGSVLNISFDTLTKDVVSMILALVVLFIAAKGFLPERFTDPVRRQAAQDEADKKRQVNVQQANVQEGAD